MDLAALKAGVADVTATYKERTFRVGYRPESVTEEDLLTLEAFQDKSGVALLQATVEPICRLLVRWDLTMGDEPLPVNEESIKFLPPRMRVSILEAIMGDFFSAGNAKASDAGSSEGAASEASAQISPASSGTPNGLASHPGSSPASLTLVGA